METHPPKRACGCPDGGVLKDDHTTGSPLTPWPAFTSVQLHKLGDSPFYPGNATATNQPREHVPGLWIRLNEQAFQDHNRPVLCLWGPLLSLCPSRVVSGFWGCLRFFYLPLSPLTTTKNKRSPLPPHLFFVQLVDLSLFKTVNNNACTGLPVSSEQRHQTGLTDRNVFGVVPALGLVWQIWRRHQKTQQQVAVLRVLLLVTLCNSFHQPPSFSCSINHIQFKISNNCTQMSEHAANDT